MRPRFNCALGVPWSAARRYHLNGFLVVLRNTVTFVIHNAEIELRCGVPLVCRQTVPLEGFLGVLRNTFAFVIHETEIELRNRISLSCQRQKFFQSSSVIAFL